MKKLLIIGCGRSGTKYAAELLQEFGIDVRHEVMGEAGMVSWFATFEDCCSLPGEHLPSISHSDYLILHQVRHPLKTIASLRTITERSWQRIALHVPEVRQTTSLLARCMHYWYVWNLAAEMKAILTFRVEDLDRRGLSKVAHDVNQREHAVLDWSVLRLEHPVL